MTCRNILLVILTWHTNKGAGEKAVLIYRTNHSLEHFLTLDKELSDFSEAL